MSQSAVFLDSDNANFGMGTSVLVDGGLALRAVDRDSSHSQTGSVSHCDLRRILRIRFSQPRQASIVSAAKRPRLTRDRDDLTGN